MGEITWVNNGGGHFSFYLGDGTPVVPTDRSEGGRPLFLIPGTDQVFDFWGNPMPDFEGNLPHPLPWTPPNTASTFQPIVTAPVFGPAGAAPPMLVTPAPLSQSGPASAPVVIPTIYPAAGGGGGSAGSAGSNATAPPTYYQENSGVPPGYGEGGAAGEGGASALSPKAIIMIVGLLLTVMK
jgi:hypothetical protein